MARRLHSVRSRGARRATSWVRTDIVSGTTAWKALAGSTSVIDQSFITDDPVTLIRARGNVVADTDQVAAGEHSFGAFGIAIVSAQAFAIGITAIPTPLTDASSDLWFVHGYWDAAISLADGTGIANTSRRVDFDSKAMRKLTPDETVVMVIENGSTTGVVYRFDFALLIKEA